MSERTDAARLLRIFLVSIGPRRSVTSSLTTSRVTLAELHAFTRRGWVEYAEDHDYSRLFGARGWRVALTSAGREAAQRLLDARGAVER